ncbi:MAG: hypothetical protein FWD84_03050 [Oscillospiraceae bacterium]|nr:hypothetical protein [Oscillospiraceae bacterium]
MGILSGILSYILGLALNLLDVAVDGFLAALGFDLDTFEAYFPAASAFHDVIIGFAVGLLFIMLIFQIFRNFGIVLDMEVEDPLKMVGKTFLFFGMIIYSRSITNLIIDLLMHPYAIFTNAAPRPYEFRLITLATAMFTSVFANPFMALLALILLLILGWQFLKLVIECVERYIVFYFVIVCAPVVMATGAFKSTNQIFKSWCRMVASQALLLLLNVWSIRLFLSFLPIFEMSRGNMIFTFLIGYAFLRFAQKADTLLRILGMNTASTGEMLRSFGGTVAGIALTIKSLSSAAGAIGGAAGKLFGGGMAAAAATAGAGATGDTVSGMSGASGSAPTGTRGGGSPGGGGSVTAAGIGAAKQNFANDVLGSARSQMGVGDGGAQGAGGDGGNSGAYRYQEGVDGIRETAGSAFGGNPGGADGPQASGRNIAMDQGASQDGAGGRRIDADTREGLANIAHGIPHNKFDPVKKSFSGGGFGEFTGENANIIGASQLTPAPGFEQHGVKMRDGSVGTLYQNAQTGEAHVVQFGSVDNGVIQGAISQLDSSTGKFGDFMAFKAVHQSVPGAQSASSHSVPVADSEGGVYHVSTGAATSFFSAGGNSKMPGGSGSAPSVSSPHSGDVASAPAPSVGNLGEASAQSPAVSSHETNPIDTSSMFGGGRTRGYGAGRSTGSGRRFPVDGQFGGRGSSSDGDSSEGARQGFGRGGRESDSPPIATGMQGQTDSPGRFSRNNPSNMEVFSREGGGTESFGRPSENSDTVPKMNKE